MGELGKVVYAAAICGGLTFPMAPGAWRSRPQARVIHVSLMAYVAYIDYVTS